MSLDIKFVTIFTLVTFSSFKLAALDMNKEFPGRKGFFG